MCEFSSSDKKVLNFGALASIAEALHFTDEASAIEVQVPNLKPYSPKKRMYTNSDMIY